MPDAPTADAPAPDQPAPDRPEWMGLLARARPQDLAAGWAALGPDPDFDWLRRPEVGTVMLRGRAGAVGAPFNLGEMTVTRASLRLACGAVGHAWVQGRDTDHARRAALADALMQTGRSEDVRATVLTPLARAEQTRRHDRAARAAATRVEFFTMVRGEG
jgi:alpha-D-ribose 1-methylphosphonate 5-triphosphate synthase subunit PhnG